MLWSQSSRMEIEEEEEKGRRDSDEYDSGWDLHQKQWKEEEEDEPMDLTN